MDCREQPEHDDHRDAHLASLRVALGLIMSPVSFKSFATLTRHFRGCILFFVIKNVVRGSETFP